MNDPQMDRENIDRLVQEAEFYETQGLYDHAILVYQNILTREPNNRFAQAKVVQIRFNQKMEETTASRSTSPNGLTPRLSLDLGLAYMGMQLYTEALDEFRRPTKASADVRVELTRHSIACLIHLERWDEARTAIEELLAEPKFDLVDKGDIIADAATVYLEKNQPQEARRLLEGLSDEIRGYVREYEVLCADASSPEPDYPEVAPSEEYEAPPKKQKPADTVDYEMKEKAGGEALPEAPEEAPGAADRGDHVGETRDGDDVSVPVKARVSYSRDNRSWRDGLSETLAPRWALLSISDSVNVGDTLVLKIHLPPETEDLTVSVISKVSRWNSEVGHDESRRVRTEFVSLSQADEGILKAFVADAIRTASGEADEALQAASSLDHVAEGHAEPQVQGFESPPAEHPAVTRPPAPVPEVPFMTEAGPRLDPSGRARVYEGPRIRFACECGQVNVIPARHTGREGKCGKCAKPMIVPAVDAKADRLTDTLIGRVVGGCRLLYKLGGGGMGGVFKAHHIPLDIAVAMKILHAHLAEKDPVFIKRFIREARAAAKLQHPNIVGVMNVGFENGLHYLVMPYVSGGSAALALVKNGRMPLEKGLRVAVEITQALIVAAEHNMLHRDIKPANILFTGKGEATLADLGLAKNYLDQDVAITQTGIACGTPLYFSPEQAKGSPNIDIRSDIYSLGVTLYHLLNGSPPFKGESAYVIFQKHVHEPLPPFDRFEPPVPEVVHDLLKKMTAKNPDERFKTPQELLEALEALIDVLTAGGTKSVNADKPAKKGLLHRLGFMKSD
jgi:tetratricopeptide (TPR) repeat protein